MQVILGVIFHFIGGFASGSFYMPFKKVRGWAWESYWIIGGLFSWLVVPPIAAWLTIPDFSEIIANTDSSTLGYTYLFGLLWGIGGLTYGLGVRYLGVALGSSIILGLCMVFGALIPSVYYQFFNEAGKDTISVIAGSTWGLTVLAGLVVCVIGIIICGKAGIMKEKQINVDDSTASLKKQTERQPKPQPVSTVETAASGIGYRHEAYDEIVTDNIGETATTTRISTGNSTEYKFALGLTVAIVSGILSACFNFGLEAAQPMSVVANDIWKAANPGQGEFLFRNNVIYVVVLW